MMKGEVHWLGILEPEAFRRFHGTGMWAGTGLGLVILALMAGRTDARTGTTGSSGQRGALRCRAER
jgi:hypothetical protein